ncbi:hypothetical protein GGR52DRAFT_112863 [Hypoxylon sp. FL1284]|nr:hypothetical protein GGR52DRAFT_112863 [Hypoxylon sp. FL1284]
MQLKYFAIAALAGVGASSPVERRQDSGGRGGNGPFKPATYTTDSSLEGHTVYLPSDTGDTKIPVFLWGNGECKANGTKSPKILEEIASYGYLVIAGGRARRAGVDDA